MDECNLPKITWCKKCVLPSNAAITLVLDEDGICSACKVQEQKKLLIGMKG